MIQQRLSIIIHGMVQGIGFRPFIYKLAHSLNLTGWVENNIHGVVIEVEGPTNNLQQFLLRLPQEKPEKAFIQSLESTYLNPIGFTEFRIKESETEGNPSALILPDMATCDACLEEVFDPDNRRYLYPFTNCTHCGPRFTIIEALPYDRDKTTMKRFKQCAACQAEYENPLDRRFHAQPNACPQCGPHLELWNQTGDVLANRHDALLKTAQALKAGKVVAIKGIGGFHLMVDARNTEAVQTLRQRKHREVKPFALMAASIEAIQEFCEVSPLEANLLNSTECPIVLLKRRHFSKSNFVADNVAPHNPYLGVMLPYSPLHHILLRETGFPLVATSGNHSDEPICISADEALVRLQSIADLFLVHNRPIVRHVDDSIAHILLGREQLLRRSRGYAPLPIPLPNPLPTVVAVGGHLKNTIAVNQGKNIFVSQHIGDLETVEAGQAFRQVIEDFQAMYHLLPQTILHDLHPSYISTQYALNAPLTPQAIQHHYAHIASCMLDNRLKGPVLGICWDGTGYGNDGSLWGGEFLFVHNGTFERVASLHPFPLPGGHQAIKEPRRAALGLLNKMMGESVLESAPPELLQAFSPSEQTLILQMLQKQINSPKTTSVGRLFDAVASLIGIRHRVYFEGQAAMELEFLLETNEANSKPEKGYPIEFSQQIDWQPMVEQLLSDQQAGVPKSQLSRNFHHTLIHLIGLAAKSVGSPQVVLSGGCFQNRYLTEQAAKHLQTLGFQPYWQQRIPPNDGGISLGQIYAYYLENQVKTKESFSNQ